MNIKRGSFFSLDAIFALVIIIFGIYLIFLPKSPNLDITRAQDIGNEVLDFLDSVTIGDICNGTYTDINCSCIYSSVQSLYCDTTAPYINSKELTLLEAISEIYSIHTNISGTPANIAIKDIINETVEQPGLVPPGYEFQIIINQYTGPNKTIRMEHQIYP